MKTQTSNRSLTSSAKRAALAVALLGGSLLGASVAHATGGGDDCDDIQCESFFSPEVTLRPSEAPFYRSWRTYYNQGWSNDSSDSNAQLEKINQTEWSGKLGGVLSPKSLNFLLYKMKSADLQALIKAVQGQPVPLSPEAKEIKAQLDRASNNALVQAELAYLDYAKRCEPIASRNAGQDVWNPAPKPSAGDISDAGTLINEGAKLIAGAKDQFLAERLRFQVIRLMFYAGRYSDAEKFYGAQLGRMTTEASPKYRFMDLAAGSFYHDKKYGQANYIYSLIFDKYEPLKKRAYYSFHPQEDGDWNQSLALAKNTREKTVLWQLLGIYADGLAAIQKIYAMDPKSNLLPLLLVREVNKAEEDWSSNQNLMNGAPDDVTQGKPKPDDEVVGRQRVAVIKSITDAAQVSQLYVWDLALGHLEAMIGDSRTSERYLHLAVKSMPAVAVVRDQARLSLLFARTRALKAVDKAQEPYFAQELAYLKALKNDRVQNFLIWDRAALSKVYAQAGDTVRSLMLTDKPTSPVYQNNAQVVQIEAFIASPNKTAFDRMLVSTYSYSKAQLEELRGINLLFAGRFMEAEALLQQGGKSANAKLLADPFMIHINDCHDCDFEVPHHATYTKVTFAAKMTDLAQRAQGQGEAAAQASFNFANGLYNMSYYGNARDIYETPNSNFSIDYGVAIPRNLNNDQAEKFYSRAASLSSDREFQAKAIFMAAKAEQNRYFNKHQDQYGEVPDDGAVHSPINFKKLKDSYSDTQYYKEIIGECGYFKKYVK